MSYFLHINMTQLAVPTKFKGEKLNIQLSRELKTHSFKN